MLKDDITLFHIVDCKVDTKADRDRIEVDQVQSVDCCRAREQQLAALFVQELKGCMKLRKDCLRSVSDKLKERRVRLVR